METIKPESYGNPNVQEKADALKYIWRITKIKYSDYISKGYFIGSGAIESRHKHVHVIQQRSKLAGMRWSKEGAQYITGLR